MSPQTYSLPPLPPFHPPSSNNPPPIICKPSGLVPPPFLSTPTKMSQPPLSPKTPRLLPSAFPKQYSPPSHFLTPTASVLSTPGTVYHSTPNGHLYAGTSDDPNPKLAFSPSMAGKFMRRSAHLSSPLFCYEARPSSYQDSHLLHPDVSVNPLARTDAEARKIPPGVVPEVCTNVEFRLVEGLVVGGEAFLGERAARVPMPYAICVKVTESEKGRRPVSGKFELDVDHISTMLVTLIDSYATFDGEEDGVELILTFWAAPERGLDKRCEANFVLGVTDESGELFDTNVKIICQSVEGKIAIERVGTAGRERNGDTHINFDATIEQGSERVVVWNESDANAPLLLNIVVKDNCNGVFGIGRGDAPDDASGEECIPVTVAGGGKYEFVVWYDLNVAKMKQTCYYGCVLVKLGNMFVDKRQRWHDRDLLLTYDYVLALQLNPPEKYIGSNDFLPEILEAQAENENNFEQFLREEGDGDVEDIYPLPVDFGAYDIRDIPEGMDEGPLHEGFFSMLEPVKWVMLNENDDDTTCQTELESETHAEKSSKDYAHEQRLPPVEQRVSSSPSNLANDEERQVTAGEPSRLGETQQSPEVSAYELSESNIVHESASDEHGKNLTILQNPIHDGWHVDKISEANIDGNSLDAEAINVASTVESQGFDDFSKEADEKFACKTPFGTLVGYGSKNNTGGESSKSRSFNEFSRDADQRFANKTPFGKLVGYGASIAADGDSSDFATKLAFFENEAPVEKDDPVAILRSKSEEQTNETIRDSVAAQVVKKSSMSKVLTQSQSASHWNGEENKVETLSATLNSLSDAKSELRKPAVEAPSNNVPVLSIEQISQSPTFLRRETFDSGNAEYGGSSSQESVDTENFFSPTFVPNLEGLSVPSSVDPKPNGVRDVEEGKLKRVDTGLPGKELDNVKKSAKSRPAQKVESLAAKNTMKGSPGILSEKGGKHISWKPPRIPDGSQKVHLKSPREPKEQENNAYTFRDHRGSANSNRTQDSISSSSTFQSIRESGMVAKTNQKYSLRSMLNKDFRPRLRMPRKIQQQGLILSSDRGSVVLPIVNGAKCDIEVTAKIERFGTKPRLIANPGFLVVRSSQRSEIVLLRHSCVGERLSIVLLCKSVQNERASTAYRVPIIVEASGSLVNNFGFTVDRPTLTFYNPVGDAKTNRVRVFNGTSNAASYQVWVGPQHLGGKGGKGSPFKLKSPSVGRLFPKESDDVVILFNAGGKIGHFYDELSIMVNTQMEKMALFAYSGGADTRLEFAGNVLRAKNYGDRHGFIVIAGPDVKSSDESTERVVIGPREELDFEMPHGTGSLIYTGDEIARVRFCKLVDRNPAGHSDDKKSVQLFKAEFKGADRAATKEGLVFRKDSRYTLYYAERLLDACTRRYCFEISGEEVNLSEVSLRDLGETWKAIAGSDGMVRIINNDPRQTLTFTSEGMEPSLGEIPPMGDASAVPFREQVTVSARGTHIDLDMGRKWKG